MESKDSNKLTVTEAAKLMDIAPQLLRMGLQENKLPFGFAVKGKRWAYYVSRPALERWLEGKWSVD